MSQNLLSAAVMIGALRVKAKILLSTLVCIPFHCSGYMSLVFVNKLNTICSVSEYVIFNCILKFT